MNPSLWIVTALRAEARPLIRAFGLRSGRSAPFGCHAWDDLGLVVSGVGRVAAAAAVGFIAGRRSADGAATARDEAVSPVAFLNVGIAGHRDLKPGAVVLAERIRRIESGESYYPVRLFDSACRTGTVVTVDRPETGYGTDALYDMEACGLAAAAQRFTTWELIHSLKVISDGPRHPVDRLDRQAIEALITGAVDDVRETVAGLRSVLATLPPGDETGLLDEALDRWRFSTSERRQLGKLLSRYRARGAPPPNFVEDADLLCCTSASELLAALTERIDTLPVSLF